MSIPLAKCARCKKEKTLFKCQFNKPVYWIPFFECERFLCEECWFDAGNNDMVAATFGFRDFIVCPDHAWHLKCKTCFSINIKPLSIMCHLCRSIFCKTCWNFAGTSEIQIEQMKEIEDPIEPVCFWCAQHQIEHPIASLRPGIRPKKENIFTYEAIGIMGMGNLETDLKIKFNE